MHRLSTRRSLMSLRPGEIARTTPDRRGWDVPDFVGVAVFRAPTPSLNATPCPNVLDRLEWVGGAEGAAAEGAGDCGRVDGAVAVFAGGPLDQADFDGS